MPVVRTDGWSVGQVITKFSGMGRLVLRSHQSSLLQKPSSSHSFSSYEAAVVADSTCAEVSESIIADIHSLGAPSSNYSSD